MTTELNGGSAGLQDRDGAPLNGLNKIQAGSLGKKTKLAEVNVPSDSTDVSRLVRRRTERPFSPSDSAKRLVSRFQLRRPDRHDWVRIHPGDDYYRVYDTLDTGKEKGDFVLLTEEVADHIRENPKCKERLLVLGITSLGEEFLWPVRLAKDDGRNDEWAKSELECLSAAAGQWVNVLSNVKTGGYDAYASNIEIPDPAWSGKSMDDVLNTVFAGRIVGSLDHPEIKKLGKILVQREG
jgi:hypothetical protein